VTGFEGVLGYRTDSDEVASHPNDVALAKAVIERLKAEGWRFASHSYTHQSKFRDGTISLDALKADTAKWNAEVRPLVGDTSLFVGPFGQVFKPNDPRRAYLVSQGFTTLFGVGMDQYQHYFSDSLVMDRADIDGYRLSHSPDMVKEYFDPAFVE
jgi:hypothetical protein